MASICESGAQGGRQVVQASPWGQNWALGALLSLHGLRQLGAREQSGPRKGQDRVWAAARQVSSWPHTAGTPRDSPLTGWTTLTLYTYISACTEISFLFYLPSL